MKKQLFSIITFLSITLAVNAQLVSTLAGTGSYGSINGAGNSATFSNPAGVCSDASGNIFVADFSNHKIRKITPLGVVSTFAGTGAAGSTDGIGTVASFSSPTGVCADASGNIYVADFGNHKIRKITPVGVVSTFAGTGTAGSTDGAGTIATFKAPNSVCLDASGNIYVSDQNNNKVRKITSLGVVSTLAGTGAAGSTDGAGTTATFNAPNGICSDASGNIFVADFSNDKIRKITPSGVVSTFAGTGLGGSSDGAGISASFLSPTGVCSDASGNIYVADFSNKKIRKITPSAVVSTLAGTGAAGSTDGLGTIATFNSPYSVCTDASGNIYVSDQINNKIRKITTCTAPASPANTTTVANAQVCVGNTATLAAAGTGTISWFLNSTGGTAIATNSILVTSSTLTVGSYTYYAEDYTCTNSDTRTPITFTVNPNPIIIVNSGTICAGMSFTINPVGAITYTYSGGSNVVSPITSNNYSVTGTNIQGCTSTAVSNVSVNALPTVSATTSSTLMCLGQTATLTPSGALTFTLLPGATAGNSFTISPVSTTNYTVYGTDANGCSNVTTVTQSVSLCTAINEFINDNKISIYPNPSKGLYHITINEECTIIVTDILGSEIMHEKLNKGEQTINLEQKVKGLYFITVIISNTKQKFKLIKE